MDYIDIDSLFTSVSAVDDKMLLSYSAISGIDVYKKLLQQLHVVVLCILILHYNMLY